MANPSAGAAVGGMPTSPAAGVARNAPPSNAAAATIPGGFPPSDFAGDLARLVALLGAGMQDAAPPVAGTAAASTDAEPTTDGEATDPLAALCAEVGLVVAGVTPPPVATSPIASGDSSPIQDDAALPLSNAPKTGRGLAVPLPPGSPPAATDDSAASVGALERAPAAPVGVPFFASPVAQASAEAKPSDAIVASGKTDAAPTQPPLPGVPVEMLAARPPSNPPHAIAATVIDAMQPQAPRQMAETVAWHVPARGAAEVQIRINPEELGPVDVQLKLDGDRVSVRFDLADERVRDVVQSSLPSLSSMLSSRGLQLDQAQVFAQSRGQGSPQPHNPMPQSFGAPVKGGGDSGGELSVTTRPLIRRGLLDDYA